MNALAAPARPMPSRPTPAWPRRDSHTPRLRSTDRATCERLFHEKRATLIAVANRILRSEEDAADAVQDAYVSAITSLDRFQAKSQLSTWLHRIVVNVCLMRLRARKRRQAASLELLADVAEETPLAEMDAPPCEGLAHLEREELRMLVHRAIERLSADHREVIMLRDLQELDTDTTAGILGISRAAVKTRLHRARQALRVQVERLAM